jgi:mannose-6-phosphate isomerase-like protein (cupin superfamily)
MLRFAGAMALFLVAISMPAQSPSPSPMPTPGVDHYSPGELLAKAHELLQAAAPGTGAVSTKLAEYPNHYTMVALRGKDGGAEVHEQFADIFCILKGHATLMTGGTVVDAKTVKPGEIQGTKVSDGKATELKEGDFVHIPAGVPHQLLLSGGGELIYFVVKVKES